MNFYVIELLTILQLIATYYNLKQL